MLIEQEQVQIEKSGNLWSLRLRAEGQPVFDSTQRGIRLKSRDAALWLAGIVEPLLTNNAFPESLTIDAGWTGDLDNDCHFDDSHFHAHAEHLSGPRRGGVWYCSVSSPCGDERYFHTADNPDIEPKTGQAARLLCSLVMAAARCGCE